MNFEFATARRIVFGAGEVDQLARHAEALGKRVLVLTGSAPDRYGAALTPLLDSGLVVARDTVTHEPDMDLIQALTDRARDRQVDAIVAIGGGSVIDAGKAVAVLCNNPGALLDYLEGVGRGKALSEPSVPLIAVPTTAGTGAEVTRNAVIAVPPRAGQPGIKVSLRSPHMLPALALVDPELTYSMPPAVSAATGMDALTQCLEPFVSRHANPLTDGLAAEGLRRAARSLRVACDPDSNRSPTAHAAARADMSIASLCGGLALANARLGAVHGFAGVIGGMASAPHGAICARLLPSVFRANNVAIEQRGPQNLADRFQRVAQILTGDPSATAHEGAQWLDDLVDSLPVARLRALGVESAQIPSIVAAAAKSSSMQGNPLDLTTSELTRILEEAL